MAVLLALQHLPTGRIGGSKPQDLHEKGLLLYFANYTSWSGKAASYVFDRNEHFHLGVEHHLTGTKLKDAKAEWSRQGYHLSYKAASLTGRSEKGTSGGAWVAAQKHIHSRSLMDPEAEHDTEGKEQNQWAGRIIRCREFDILVIAAYFSDGNQAEGRLSMLTKLAACIQKFNLQWIVMADCNQEPEQLEGSGWLSFVKGEIIHVNSKTCVAGQGRNLDYAVISPGLAPYVKMELDPDSPWSPHFGLLVCINTHKEIHQIRKFEPVQEIPEAMGPFRMPWAGYLRIARDRQRNHKNQATFQCNGLATNEELTEDYGTFSAAAEMALADRAGL